MCRFFWLCEKNRKKSERESGALVSSWLIFNYCLSHSGRRGLTGSATTSILLMYELTLLVESVLVLRAVRTLIRSSFNLWSRIRSAASYSPGGGLDDVCRCCGHALAVLLVGLSLSVFMGKSNFSFRRNSRY